jgi:16S rRNA processing protein RimM
MAGDTRVCLGQIGAAHGVGGEVRLRSFTADPVAIAGYGPLQTEDGRVLQIEALRPTKDHFVARLAGIRDRDAARALANAKLYVPRERLPEPAEPDEFYHADLIGLAAFDTAGNKVGNVVAIHNFGAGDLIEVAPDVGNNTELIPFDQTRVPVVDIAAGKIIVNLPEARGQTPLPSKERSTAKRSGRG